MANMLFANNCNTTLNGSITNVATTMSVTSATGFPSPTGSQYFYCTLADAATQTTIEIVKVTAVSGTTFTIVRGQDGTSGTAFASGAVVSLRLVRASLNDFPKLDETNTFTADQAITGQLTTSAGLATTNSFTATPPADGLVMDYATGFGRFSAFAGDGFQWFNAGVGTTKLMQLSSTGVITTATWNGATVGTGYGGTGLTSFTANGIVYASSTSALATGSALTFDGTNLVVNTTGAIQMPVGTTAQRPGSPASGMFRMNSTTKEPEWYDSANSVWVPFAQAGGSAYQVQYLTVAGGGGGGGGGGNGGAGGGGAGGFRTNSGYVVTSGIAYTVTVGAGGAAGTGNLVAGSNGNNSVFDAITSTGGGGGGAGYVAGVSGGSGGGSGGVSTTSPSGTTGQGNNGGAGIGSVANYTGGGGGGAGTVGATGTALQAGNGGNGLPSTISGSSVTYAGGGGASVENTGTNGTGGTGGGGVGGTVGVPNGTAGTANTGGGGGGGYGSGASVAGSAGGSGVVIISYPGVQKATGGTITSVGGYTIHTFTSSGTFTA